MLLERLQLCADHLQAFESTALEARLCTALPTLELAEFGKRLKVVGAELQALEEQWLNLSEALTA